MRRTVVSAIALWLAVVAVGSTVVWAVISRAGDGLGSTADPAVIATLPAGGPSRPPTSPSPTRHPSPSASTATPGGTGSPAVTPQRRTWQGPGGFLTVECRGAEAALVARSADIGFVVEPTSQGPEEVTVRFEGQGEEGRETEVTARCVGGVPVFVARAGGD